MSCKIVKTENGTILEVRDNKGNTSLLYDNLLEKYKDPNLALDLWTVVYSSQFKSIYGESNEEPSLLEFEKMLQKMIGTSKKEEQFNTYGSRTTDTISEDETPIQMYIKNEDGTEEASGMYLPSIEKRINTLKEKKIAFESKVKRLLNQKELELSETQLGSINNKIAAVSALYDDKINSIDSAKRDRNSLINDLKSGRVISGVIQYENSGYTIKTERSEETDSLKKIPIYKSIGNKSEVKKKDLKLAFKSKDGIVRVNSVITDKDGNPVLYEFDENGEMYVSEKGTPKNEFKPVLVSKGTEFREVGITVRDNLGNTRFIPLFENYVNNRNGVVNQEFLDNYKAFVMDLFSVLSDQTPITRVVDIVANPLFVKKNNYKTLFNFLSQFHSGVTVNNWDKDNRKVLAEAMKSNNMVYLNHNSSLAELKTLYFINKRNKTIFYIKPGYDSNTIIDLKRRHEALLQDDEMEGYTIVEIDKNANLNELLFTDKGIFNQMRFSFNLEKSNTIFIPNVNEDGSISLIEKDYLDYINDTNVMSMTTQSVNIGTEENPDYQMFFNPLVRLVKDEKRQDVSTKLDISTTNLKETEDKKQYFEEVNAEIRYYDRVTSLITDEEINVEETFEVLLGRVIHNSFSGEIENYNENLQKIKDIYYNNYSKDEANKKIDLLLKEIETIKTLIHKELDANEFKIVSQELLVSNYNLELNKGVAGRIDLIVQDKYSNLHIIDIKTSSYPYEEKSLKTKQYYEAQAGYYKVLFNENSIEKIESVYILHLENNVNDSHQIENTEVTLHKITPLRVELYQDNTEVTEDLPGDIFDDFEGSRDDNFFASLDEGERINYKNKLSSITIYSHTVLKQTKKEDGSIEKQLVAIEASKDETHRMFQYISLGIIEIMNNEGLDVNSAINKYFSTVKSSDLALTTDMKANIKATIYFQIKDTYSKGLKGAVTNNNAKKVLLEYLATYGKKTTLAKFNEEVLNKKSYQDIDIDSIEIQEPILDDEGNKAKPEEKDFKERPVDPTSYIKEELIQLILRCRQGTIRKLEGDTNDYKEVPNIDDKLQLPLYVVNWRNVVDDIKLSVENWLDDNGEFSKEDLLAIIERMYKNGSNLIYYQLYTRLKNPENSQSLNQMFQYLSMHYVKHAADNIVKNNLNANRKREKGSNSDIDESIWNAIGNVANALADSKIYSKEGKGYKKSTAVLTLMEGLSNAIIESKKKRGQLKYLLKKDESFNQDLNSFEKNAKQFIESLDDNLSNVKEHSLMIHYLHLLGFSKADIVNMMTYFYNEAGYHIKPKTPKTSIFNEIVNLKIHNKKDFFDDFKKNKTDILKKINGRRNKHILELFLPAMTMVSGNKIKSFMRAGKMRYPLVRNNHLQKTLRHLRSDKITDRVKRNLFLSSLKNLVQTKDVDIAYLIEPVFDGETKDLNSLNDFEMDLVLLNNFFYGFDQYNNTNGHGFISPTNSVVGQKVLVTYRSLLADVKMQPDVVVKFSKESTSIDFEIKDIKLDYSKRINKKNNPFIIFIKNEYARMKVAHERFEIANKHYKTTNDKSKFESLRLNDDYYVNKNGEYIPGLGTYFIQFGTLNSVLDNSHPLSESAINKAYGNEENYIEELSMIVLKEHGERLKEEITNALNNGVLKKRGDNVVFNDYINYNKKEGILEKDHLDYFAQFHLNQELSNLLYNQITFHPGYVSKVIENNGSINLTSSINETLESYGKRKKSNMSPLDNVDSKSIEIRAIVMDDFKYDFSKINPLEFKKMIFSNLLSKYYVFRNESITTEDFESKLKLLISDENTYAKNLNSYFLRFNEIIAVLSQNEKESLESYLRTIYKIDDKNNIESYTNIDKTDGAVYTHIHEGIDNLLSKGMINDNEALFLKELHSSPKNFDTYLIIMNSIASKTKIIVNNQSLKEYLSAMGYRGPKDNHKVDKLIKLGISANKSGVFGEDTYMKCAEFYLSPMLHTFGFGKEALSLMTKYKANRVVFRSSMKKLVPESHVYSKGKLNFQVLTMNSEDFGNQLQTQGETKTKINNPSQMDMIMFSNYEQWKGFTFNFIDNGLNTVISGEQLANKYNASLKNLMNALVENYASKFNLVVKTDPDTQIKYCKFKDRYSFVQYCYSIIENGDANDIISNQLKDFLYLNNQDALEALSVKLNEDINGINKLYEAGTISKKEKADSLDAVTKEYNKNRGLKVNDSKFSGIPFFHENWNSLTRMIISHYHKNVIKPKVNGSIMSLNPECLIKEENVLRAEENKNLFDNNSIIFSDPNRIDPNLGPNEVIISWAMLTSNFDGELNLMDFTKKVNGKLVIDIEKIDPRLLRCIGYRIPMQGPNSVRSLVIAGFFVPGINNTVMASSALIDQTGWDFDIDKLYMLFPYSKVGFKKENTTNNQKTTNTIKDDLDLFLSRNSELINTYPNFIRKNIKLYLADNFEDNKKGRKLKENVMNSIVMYLGLYDKNTYLTYLQKETKKDENGNDVTIEDSDSYNQDLFEIKYSFFNQSQILEDVYKPNSYGELIKLAKSYKKSKTKGVITSFSNKRRRDEDAAARDGQHGIAKFSLWTTGIAKLQLAKVRLKDEFAVTYVDYDGEDIVSQRLDRIYTLNQNSKILSTIQILGSISVDNEKEPIMSTINLIGETFNLAGVLGTLGFDDTQIFRVLTFPLFDEFIQNYKYTGSKSISLSNLLKKHNKNGELEGYKAGISNITLFRGNDISDNFNTLQSIIMLMEAGDETLGFLKSLNNNAEENPESEFELINDGKKMENLLSKKFIYLSVGEETINKSDNSITREKEGIFELNGNLNVFGLIDEFFNKNATMLFSTTENGASLNFLYSDDVYNMFHDIFKRYTKNDTEFNGSENLKLFFNGLNTYLYNIVNVDSRNDLYDKFMISGNESKMLLYNRLTTMKAKIKKTENPNSTMESFLNLFYIPFDKDEIFFTNYSGLSYNEIQKMVYESLLVNDEEYTNLVRDILTYYIIKGDHVSKKVDFLKFIPMEVVKEFIGNKLDFIYDLDSNDFDKQLSAQDQFKKIAESYVLNYIIKNKKYIPEAMMKFDQNSNEYFKAAEVIDSNKLIGATRKINDKPVNYPLVSVFDKIYSYNSTDNKYVEIKKKDMYGHTMKLLDENTILDEYEYDTTNSKEVINYIASKINRLSGQVIPINAFYSKLLDIFSRVKYNDIKVIQGDSNSYDPKERKLYINKYYDKKMNKDLHGFISDSIEPLLEATLDLIELNKTEDFVLDEVYQYFKDINNLSPDFAKSIEIEKITELARERKMSQMVMNLFKDDLEENGGFYSPDDALAGFSTFIDIITNYGKFSESKSFKSILELMSNSFPFMDEQYLKHKDTISNDIANNVSSDYSDVTKMFMKKNNFKNASAFFIASYNSLTDLEAKTLNQNNPNHSAFQTIAFQEVLGSFLSLLNEDQTKVNAKTQDQREMFSKAIASLNDLFTFKKLAISFKEEYSNLDVSGLDMSLSERLKLIYKDKKVNTVIDVVYSMVMNNGVKDNSLAEDEYVYKLLKMIYDEDNKLNIVNFISENQFSIEKELRKLAKDEHLQSFNDVFFNFNVYLNDRSSKYTFNYTQERTLLNAVDQYMIDNPTSNPKIVSFSSKGIPMLSKAEDVFTINVNDSYDFNHELRTVDEVLEDLHDLVQNNPGEAIFFEIDRQNQFSLIQFKDKEMLPIQLLSLYLHQNKESFNNLFFVNNRVKEDFLRNADYTSELKDKIDLLNEELMINKIPKTKIVKQETQKPAKVTKSKEKEIKNCK